MADQIPQPGTTTKPKLLDQVRQAIRNKHDSYRTEQAYVFWIKRFIVFHKKRHPQEIGEKVITKLIKFRLTNSCTFG